MVDLKFADHHHISLSCPGCCFWAPAPLVPAQLLETHLGIQRRDGHWEKHLVML